MRAAQAATITLSRRSIVTDGTMAGATAGKAKVRGPWIRPITVLRKLHNCRIMVPKLTYTAAVKKGPMYSAAVAK